MRARFAVLVLSLLVPVALSAQGRTFTHADTLRGSNGPGRAWWDVAFYDLHVRVSPADSSISGWNGISYRVLQPRQEMQIDLQTPMRVDSMVYGDGGRLSYRRDGNAFFAALTDPQREGDVNTVRVYFHGKPKVARRPPWDGGYIWQRDSLGNRWVATANEGLGASVWWPNKDYLADEPDSQRIAITVPDPMEDVSNGRLRSVTANEDGTTTYEWFVADPINNYDIEVNAGTYAHWTEMYQGEGGPLTMDFWPLRYHMDAARRQWAQAVPMMRCFEHWFGPYPWYKDGYKLVEAPHLGMEHQSGIAYGNGFQNGYLGRDLSRTGWGLKWDFIVVHESAHEWWGNSITDKDPADMWIHEAFANYAENLFTECQTGSKEAGADYVIGTRRLVRNDRPIIGTYGVNSEGSGDMYYKGGNMLHTIRQLVNDDEKWRMILRGLNSTFRHQTVTTKQIEEYMARHSGLKLDKVFDEYLRTTMIPELEYKVDAGTLSYRWADVVTGFDMAVRAKTAPDAWTLLHPTESWQSMPTMLPDAAAFEVDRNFYVTAKDVGGEGR
ncbi:MAG: M1 family metallopeptidase [Gemmatimonadetes bacterium]|nr:M1 family metallopeptidase [Gemmatimonadota bacterium]